MKIISHRMCPQSAVKCSLPLGIGQVHHNTWRVPRAANPP
uniref:Uncharacterized protein n=1 Tax=Anguilla anguilla TaxID=7936 RepID=A0A0E9TFZ6_ANGAN